MPLIDYYVDGWVPNAKYEGIIANANAICAEYLAQQFDLTLRQLYYQFVARGLFTNVQENYDLLGRVCVKAREHGLMDWRYLVDRTRNLVVVPHWETPADILASAAESFRLDKWADATHMVEVWVEKEALAGIIQRAAADVDTAAFPCRGYVSTSEVWVASQRIVSYIEDGREVTILYLGDHDPSGLQMSDDITRRLELYVGGHVGADVDKLHIKRIALTMAQINQYNPPPDFAKTTDSRYRSYVNRTGQNQSWELDALDPNVLLALIEAEVLALRDESVWDAASAEEDEHRRLLGAVRDRWTQVTEYVDQLEGENP